MQCCKKDILTLKVENYRDINEGIVLESKLQKKLINVNDSLKEL